MPPPPAEPTAEERLAAAQERAVRVAPELGAGYGTPVIGNNVHDTAADAAILTVDDSTLVISGNDVGSTEAQQIEAYDNKPENDARE